MGSQRKNSSYPGGYTDNIYRTRQSGGVEGKSRFCCFYFTRTVVLVFLLVCLLAAGALSVLSVALGYKNRWTYNVNRSVNPAFTIRTGWLYFSTSQMASGVKVNLKTLSKGTYILGIIAAAMNCLSVIFAALFSIRALCGRIGRGFICFTVPFSILLIAALGGYYIVTALEVYQYSGREVDSSRVPWPDWAWGLGAGAALLWFLSAGVASVIPRKHKYFDAEQEFEASPATVYPPPVSEPHVYPAESPYHPTSPEHSRVNGYGIPGNAQENPVYENTETKKKSFLPSWSKRASSTGEETSPIAEPAPQYDVPAGSYRAKAEEISHRYRSRDKSDSQVEMGTPSAPPVPKGAW